MIYVYCGVMEQGTDPSYPPLETKYADLLQQQNPSWISQEHRGEDCEFPVIDLELLRSQNCSDRHHCSRQIFDASSQWGFFQIINHGVPPDLFEKVRLETRKIFSLPFQVKNNEVNKVFPYAWATAPGYVFKNPNWMENFIVTSHSIKSQSPSFTDDGIHDIDFSAFSAIMEEYGRLMGKIAFQILGVLASELGLKPGYFRDCYSEGRSFIKLNHYPPCPKENAIDGLEPHTDSSLLSLIHQDDVGGLQILKNQKWVGVKPRQDALVINIGDLLQAWSNDVYHSVLHKVTAKSKERISVVYFVMPDGETCILSSDESGRHYRGFTFNELKAQVQQDFQLTGSKIGLPHFRVPS